jgi:hypothetical protein
MRVGPDLTRVETARSVAYLTESIREPDKGLSLPAGAALFALALAEN